MGASVWRVGQTAEDQVMWRSGWGQVSGEWDKQQKISRCGGVDGGKCLESGTNSRKSADVYKIYNNNNGRNGSFFYVAGYLIEERRRWPVITASPRGQSSK